MKSGDKLFVIYFWQEYMNVISSFLNDKRVTVGCLTLAILCKLALMFYFFQFQGDKMHQAVAAKSFINGGGISLAMVSGDNLSVVKHKPLTAWPPGYSLLLAPIYIITKDLKLSTLVVDVIVAIGFFLIFFFLLKKLRLANPLIILLLLFNSVFLSQDIFYSSPTDLLSISFILLAIYYVLLLNEKKSPALYEGFFLGVFCFLPALFKYLYLPIASVIPLIFLSYGWSRKNKNQIITGTIALVITWMQYLLILFYLKSSHGYTGNNPTAGIELNLNFEQLQHIHPFIFSSIINLDFLAQQISLLTGYRYEAIVSVFQFLNYPLLFGLLIFLITMIWRQGFKIQSTQDLFIATSLIISFSIIFFLCFLSVIQTFNFNWTYVQEERYYKFIAICLPVIFLYFLYVKQKTKPSLVRRVIQYGLVILLSLETMHGFYFIGKNVLPSQKLQLMNFKINEPFLKEFINEYKAKGMNVVITSPNIYYNAYAVYYEAQALYNSGDINKPLFAETQTMLLAILDEDQLINYKTFLEKKGVRKETKLKMTYFFSLQLEANAIN